MPLPLDTPEWNYSSAPRDANHLLLRSLSEAPRVIQPILTNMVKESFTSVSEDGQLVVAVTFKSIQNALEEAHKARVHDLFVAMTIVGGSFVVAAVAFFLLKSNY